MTTKAKKELLKSFGQNQYCSNNLSNKPTLCSQDRYLTHKFIYLNNLLSKHISIVIPKNVDIPEHLPKPTLIIACKSYKSLVWELQSAVCLSKRGDCEIKSLLHLINQCLTHTVGCASFSGVTHNPLYKGNEIKCNETRHSLSDLYKLLKSTADEINLFKFLSLKTEYNHLRKIQSQNELFHTLRKWSYNHVKKVSSESEWLAASKNYISSFDLSLLSDTVINGVIERVGRWTWENRENFFNNYKRTALDSSLVKQRQSISAKKTNHTRKSKTQALLEEGVKVLLSKKMKVTQANLELFVTVSGRTIKRYWNWIKERLNYLSTKTVNKAVDISKASSSFEKKVTHGVEHKLCINNLGYSKYINNNTVNFSKTNLDEIGQDLRPFQINYVKGMISNLKQKHAIKISAPKQFLAECLYAITEPTQLKGIQSFKHRVNIIASLVKAKRWRTPIGFFNYSEAGRLAKASQQKRSEKELNLKKVANTELLQRFEQRQYDGLTQKALAEAKQIKQLQHRLVKEPAAQSVIQDILDQSLRRIQQWVGQGADLTQIKAYLES